MLLFFPLILCQGLYFREGFRRYGKTSYSTIKQLNENFSEVAKINKYVSFYVEHLQRIALHLCQSADFHHLFRSIWQLFSENSLELIIPISCSFTDRCYLFLGLFSYFCGFYPLNMSQICSHLFIPPP